MSCFDDAAIARAATLGDPHPHLSTCLSCRRRLEQDRATRSTLQLLAIPSLPTERRRALAAELIAIADHAPRLRRRTAALAMSVGALAAAVALFVHAQPPLPSIAVESFAVAAVEPITATSSNVSHLDAPPILAPPRIDASSATFRHVAGSERDVITLYDGAIELDTRAARDADVRIGEALVRVDNAAVKVRARGHAIVSVQVVVGAAQVTTATERLAVHRDAMWIASSAAKQQSLAAFRDAWVALRAGRHREALELFDRVSDPIVIEEATYWAAIAARRSGDAELAADRLAKFLQRFPRSPYAADLQ